MHVCSNLTFSLADFLDAKKDFRPFYPYYPPVHSEFYWAPIGEAFKFCGPQSKVPYAFPSHFNYLFSATIRHPSI